MGGKRSGWVSSRCGAAAEPRSYRGGELRCLMRELQCAMVVAPRSAVLWGGREPRRASPRIRSGSPRTGAGVCASTEARGQSKRPWARRSLARASARRGGTAFPICLAISTRVPHQTKSSGKD